MATNHSATPRQLGAQRRKVGYINIMSYEIRNRGTDSRVGTSSQFAPVEQELKDGEYHSYLGYIRGSLYYGPDMRLRIGDAEGVAKKSASSGAYVIMAEGKTPSDVNQVVNRLHKELGEVDLTPPPTLPTLGLPKLGGFFRRVKFIFWDYLVRGRIPEGDNVPALEADEETEGSKPVDETDKGTEES